MTQNKLGLSQLKHLQLLLVLCLELPGLMWPWHSLSTGSRQLDLQQKPTTSWHGARCMAHFSLPFVCNSAHAGVASTGTTMVLPIEVLGSRSGLIVRSLTSCRELHLTRGIVALPHRPNIQRTHLGFRQDLSCSFSRSVLWVCRMIKRI